MIIYARGLSHKLTGIYRGLYYKKIYGHNFTDFRNKLEYLSLARAYPVGSWPYPQTLD